MSQVASVADTARLRPVENREPVPLTVLLADSQPAVRYWVRAALENAGVFVVGEAATANAAIAETARHRPAVLVIDPQLGAPVTGDVLGRVAVVSPGTKVLVLSSVDDDTAIRSAFHAGARGYLVKGADVGQIVRGVQVVAAGEAIIGRAIAARFGALLGTAAGPEPYPFPRLTAREREVLERIAAGKSNAVIARELGLAPKTISNRVSAVFAKLAVADRAQAIVLARDAGLGRGGFTGDREQFPYRRETGRA